MKKLLTLTLSASLTLNIAGCATTGKKNISNESHSFSKSNPIVASLLLGTNVGNTIGQTMDQQDLSRIQAAIVNGQSDSWTNPTTNDHYQLTPAPLTYQWNSNTCREYRLQTTIQGKTKIINGSACQQADSSWQTVQLPSA